MRPIDADALIKKFGELTVMLWLDSVEEAEIVSLIGNAPTIEPNLILPERMERGDIYEVGETIVVMNHDDYYDLLCKSWVPKCGEWVFDEKGYFACSGGYEPTTQTETQNSNLTFEKDECAKEYEELGLKELKELINADRKTESSSEKPNNCEECEHWNDAEDGCADRHGCKPEPTISKMEQVEPQTERSIDDFQNGISASHNLRTVEDGNEQPLKGSERLVKGKDEPQTDCCIYDSQRDYEYDLALDQYEGSEL